MPTVLQQSFPPDPADSGLDPKLSEAMGIILSESRLFEKWFTHLWTSVNGITVMFRGDLESEWWNTLVGFRLLSDDSIHVNIRPSPSAPSVDLKSSDIRGIAFDLDGLLQHGLAGLEVRTALEAMP